MTDLVAYKIVDFVSAQVIDTWARVGFDRPVRGDFIRINGRFHEVERVLIDVVPIKGEGMSEGAVTHYQVFTVIVKRLGYTTPDFNRAAGAEPRGN